MGDMTLSPGIPRARERKVGLAVDENTVPFSSRMSNGLGASLLGTLASVHRGQGRPEGRGRSPQISSGRSDKQEDLQDVSWVATRRVDLSTCLPES